MLNVKVNSFPYLKYNNMKKKCALRLRRGFTSSSVVKNPPAMQETRVPSLGQKDPLEEGIATHSRNAFGCFQEI